MLNHHRLDLLDMRWMGGIFLGDHHHIGQAQMRRARIVVGKYFAVR